jgi:hypothetical protein
MGVAVLAVVVAIGLANLAVRGHRFEYAIGLVAVAAVALRLLLVTPAAGGLLLFVALGTSLLLPRGVPDTVPRHWAKRSTR